MERWHRAQVVRTEQELAANSHSAVQQEEADDTHDTQQSEHEEVGLTTLGNQTPLFVTTQRPNRLPPHMRRQQQQGPSTPISAHQLQLATFTAQEADGTAPLDRFKTLNAQDRRKVREAMNKLGLEVPEFMAAGEHAGGTTQEDDMDEDTGDRAGESPTRSGHVSHNIDVARSSESPLPATSVPKATVTAEIAPAPNIRPSQPLTCKQEFLGTYAGDPSRLEAFLSRVRDVLRSDSSSSAWTAAVLRALPIALRDNAAVWHEGLSDDEAATLTTFENWAAAMRSAFPINESRQRREARERKWNPAKELVAAYYFQKIRLLRQAYGSDQTEKALVTDIRDGFPTSFITMLRLTRKNPTLQELRDEMSEWEPHWRERYRTPLETSATTPSTPSATTSAHTSQATPPALGRLQTQAMVRSASAPSLPVGASRAIQPALSPLAASYDPSRVIPAANGEPRKYRVDGKPTPMVLNRPCNKCQGDHFNFEHNHLVAQPQVRTVVVDEDDDYPFENEQGPSAYTTMPESQVEVEEEQITQETILSSSSMETGPAPSMSNSHDDMKSIDSNVQSEHMPETTGTLFLVDRPIFSTPRKLRPNEAVPALSQPKRAFGNVVVLPRQAATGTGQGYRPHIPLTAHIRVNDTDGRALSTLIDTGATLSCIDASLLEKMGESRLVQL
ncbi:hypothetical protein A4X13_0g6141 [Tilletia indica]|uniref:Uncharacterized protein n=1 Tax=Tilletia indica TaxID=43049 RepID=A0A177TJ85_9BASI|nr:hypothetical protein A4X13_0g6141 [Tilletia indica]